MSSSDRSDGSESGRKTPPGAPSEPVKPEPIERSPRGRVIIRSSSHPPASEGGADPRDVSGARALPASDRAPAGAEDEGAEARSKRSTPAERPRRRRQVRAERAPQPMTAPRTSGAERPHALGARRSTPDRFASTRAEQVAARTKRSRATTIAVAVAIAILVGAAFWLLRR